MASTNTSSRIQSAGNPFTKDKTLAAMKKRWSSMTPEQRKSNVENFRSAAKGKPKGGATSTKPPVSNTSAAAQRKKNFDGVGPSDTQRRKDSSPEAMTPRRKGQSPRAGSRASSGNKTSTPKTSSPTRSRAQNRRSSSTSQSRATNARRRGLSNNLREMREAARKRAHKNGVFKSSYNRR